MEHKDNPAEYGNMLSEAFENYESALEAYRQLFTIHKDKAYQEAIERVIIKMARIKPFDQ